MKQMIVLFAVLIVFGYDASSQNMVTPAPAGFDIFVKSGRDRRDRHSVLLQTSSV